MHYFTSAGANLNASERVVGTTNTSADVFVFDYGTYLTHLLHGKQHGIHQWYLPLGKSLINKTVGEVAKVDVPAGIIEYKILEINK